jgi:haloalkane dehalogenase
LSDKKNYFLEFKCKVGSLNATGVDLITLNDDGLIIAFEVVMRPNKSVRDLRVAMNKKTSEDPFFKGLAFNKPVYNTKPYANKKSLTINGRSMAYIDEGEGDTIVFQHGNPTSSYLWRNIMPHLKGQGRLIACDLIGMGDSDKLENSGSDTYSYFQQREFLFQLFDKLNLGNRIIFVVHDWGSVLGFDWANQNRHRVQAIAHMEGIVKPLEWDEFPESARDVFKGFRSAAGERMILEKNIFVEGVLPSAVMRSLSEIEMTEYRRPFSNAGEDRRPTLSWPRQIPVGGEPKEVIKIVQDYGNWLSTSAVPKLFINANPGSMLVGKQREFCRSWPNQTEVTVKGLHFIQEDSPQEIGESLSKFVQKIRP